MGHSAKAPKASEQSWVSLGQVLQALRDADDLQAVIDITLTYLKREFAHHYRLIWLGMYDQADHRLVGKGGTLSEDADKLLRQSFSLTSGDLLEQVVMLQRPVAVADLRQESRVHNWQQIAERQGIQGTMIFPLTHRDRCFGMIMLGSTSWGAVPSTQEKAHLMMIMGEVAAICERVEVDWQRQQIKRLDQPLLCLTDRLRGLAQLGPRLAAVIEETHRFVAARRTSIYWFEPQQRYFWQRITSQHGGAVPLDKPAPTAGLTVQSVRPFYQSLLNDQLVCLSRNNDAIRSDTAQRLLNSMRARSLMIAPILSEGKLFGFLAVEGDETRHWQDVEQQYLKAAAQLVALAAPLEQLETVIQQSQLDNQLITDIAQSLYSRADWRQTITLTAERLSQRLKNDRLLLIVHNQETGQFDICYQTHAQRRRPFNQKLPPLSELDYQLIEGQPQPIAIENWDDDLRLVAWRQAFMQQGVKSTLFCNTAPGQILEGILVIGSETGRSWTQVETNLFQIAAQQMGLILHQWQLQRQQGRTQSLQATLQQAIECMQGCNQIDDLADCGLNALSQVTESPLAILIDWFPGDAQAQVICPMKAIDQRFNLESDPLDIESEPLLQQVLAQPELVFYDMADLPAPTGQWFQLQPQVNQPYTGRMMAMALRPNSDATTPIGIVIVADVGDRHWSEDHQLAFITLANQLAWCRRTIRLATRFYQKHETLAQLTWYKQRHFESVYDRINHGVKCLANLKQPGQERTAIDRQQQIVRQLQDAMLPLQQMLDGEFWELQMNAESMPFISLLRRTLDRVDMVVKDRQLWMQVHHNDNPLVVGDGMKLGLIMYEILLSACTRSAVRSRVDIWCRQIEPSWMEVAVTDTSDLDPQLMEAVNYGHRWDDLNPLPMDDQEARHLIICKLLAQEMGAEFTIVRLEDQRIMSRLVLPLAAPD